MILSVRLSVCLHVVFLAGTSYLLVQTLLLQDVSFSHNRLRHRQIDDSIMPTANHTACVQCDRLKWKLHRNSNFCGMHLSGILLL